MIYDNYILISSNFLDKRSSANETTSESDDGRNWSAKAKMNENVHCLLSTEQKERKRNGIEEDLIDNLIIAR